MYNWPIASFYRLDIHRHWCPMMCVWSQKKIIFMYERLFFSSQNSHTVKNSERLQICSSFSSRLHQPTTPERTPAFPARFRSQSQSQLHTLFLLQVPILTPAPTLTQTLTQYGKTMHVRHVERLSGTCTILIGTGCPTRTRSLTLVPSANSVLRGRIGWVTTSDLTRAAWRNHTCVHIVPRVSHGEGVTRTQSPWKLIPCAVALTWTGKDLANLWNSTGRVKGCFFKKDIPWCFLVLVLSPTSSVPNFLLLSKCLEI